MTALEIILLICGIICVAASFIISDKKEENRNAESYDLNDKQKEEVKDLINKLVIDEIEAVHDRTEAQLDKISNTKILELSEYAETILGEINRNHNETVFLYDMLNEKAKEVKSTVKDVNITRRQVEKIQAEVADHNTSGISAFDTTGTPDKTNDSDVGETPSKITAKNRLSNIVRKSVDEGRDKPEAWPVKSEKAGMNTEEITEVKKTKLKSQKTAKTKSIESNDSLPVKNTVPDDISEINIQFEKGTNKNDKILKLFHEGKNNKEIAKELNLGVGEVKLVIDLYNSGK